MRFLLKIVKKKALFRPCGGRFGQIAFSNGRNLKIVPRAANRLQNVKTVRFPWKFYKRRFSSCAQQVLAKWHFSASQISKSYWRRFEASQTILGSQTMKNAIWPKRSPHGHKNCFFFYNFNGKRTVFKYRWPFETGKTILRSGTLKNAICPKHSVHGLKTAFCTTLTESALFSRILDDLRPVWLFWDLRRWKMRFGQNVLHTGWKARFVQFSWKAHCLHVFSTIWGRWQHSKIWVVKKCDFAKNVLRMAWKARFVQFS